MSQKIHGLCEHCDHKCKQFSNVDIVTCEWIRKSSKAKKLAVKYTKEWMKRKVL